MGKVRTDSEHIIDFIEFNGISQKSVNPLFKPFYEGKRLRAIRLATKYNIDPALLAAITEEESGTSGPSYAFSNRNNAMGISPNDGGPRNFNSIDDSINYAARILSNPNGAYANDYTIGQLWYTYSPPGANNDPNDTNKGWGPAVATLYSNLKNKPGGGG